MCNNTLFSFIFTVSRLFFYVLIIKQYGNKPKYTSTAQHNIIGIDHDICDDEPQEVKE